MTYFVDLNRREQQVTRLYWLLVLHGPLTLPEIREQTNWTTHRANNYLARLKEAGAVRLIERRKHGISGHRCGKWQAITANAEPGAISA